jgi:hypothetical protein
MLSEMVVLLVYLIRIVAEHRGTVIDGPSRRQFNVDGGHFSEPNTTEIPGEFKAVSAIQSPELEQAYRSTTVIDLGTLQTVLSYWRLVHLLRTF